ncbi:MAG: HNH endonuclease [Candidatus Omnitrophica bacterium]|nr:HNH endonuclease [Candidatus Omnitrophota bacterium]
MPKILTVGDALYWAYANLAMAHKGVSDKDHKYVVLHFSIRAKLFSGLKKKTMNLGSIADDERLKMILPQACCYCGTSERLSLDHLVPTKLGGDDAGDNMVWACKSCNSSKGCRDMLEWFAKRNEFPPLLLLRRYLKLAIRWFESADLMETPLETEFPQDVPFKISFLPDKFPPPNELKLWVVELPV